MISDTEIMKNTYAQLVMWIKELLAMRRDDVKVYDRNIWQAGRIMSLEFDLRRYKHMMVEDKEETVVEKYANDVVSLEEVRKNKAKFRTVTGGGVPPDSEWLPKMEWGTEFLVRPKVQKTWLLVKFMMGGVQNGCVLVIPVRGDEPIQDDKEWMWVDPVEFCKYWELMAILLVPEKDNE